MLFDGEIHKDPTFDIVPEIPPDIVGLWPHFDSCDYHWWVSQSGIVASYCGRCHQIDGDLFEASNMGSDININKELLPPCVVSGPRTSGEEQEREQR